MSHEFFGGKTTEKLAQALRGLVLCFLRCTPSLKCSGNTKKNSDFEWILERFVSLARPKMSFDCHCGVKCELNNFHTKRIRFEKFTSDGSLKQNQILMSVSMRIFSNGRW